MKNIKDITISIFAVIGFVAIITGFTRNENNNAIQSSYAIPESHIWEVRCSPSNDLGRCYMYNKITGDIRILGSGGTANGYRIMGSDGKELKQDK